MTTIAFGKGLIVPREWLVTNKYPHTKKADIRPADQTFLTFPEWFLVFSPKEQAYYFKKYTATSFPFMSHTAQIWESYKIVNDQIKDNFPMNTGYHFMIWVIGTSVTVEYSVKAWYETLVGRITDTHESLTEEDRFNADFTQSYVDFIRDRPWYEYNFKRKLGELLSAVPWFGSHFARKAERRYIITSELIVKFVYGKLIGIATKQVYDEALPTTAIIMENDSLQYLPRYDKFIQAAMQLAVANHSFKEIAGNNSAILLTVIIPKQKELILQNAIRIFEQPIVSENTTKRIALVTTVAHLNELLLHLKTDNIEIEHIFDY